MENTFGFAIASTIIYTLFCFIDMRFLRKEQILLKTQIRNSVFVFISSLLAIYLLRSIGGDEIVDSGSKSIGAFTGAPGF